MRSFDQCVQSTGLDADELNQILYQALEEGMDYIRFNWDVCSPIGTISYISFHMTNNESDNAGEVSTFLILDVIDLTGSAPH